MNRLEQQIFDILYQEMEDDSSETEIAQKLAKITLQIAKDAYKRGRMYENPDTPERLLDRGFDQFKQEIL